MLLVYPQLWIFYWLLVNQWYLLTNNFINFMTRTWKVCPAYLRKFITSIFFLTFKESFDLYYQAASKSLACLRVSHKNTLSHDHACSHNQTKKFQFRFILTHDYVFSSDHADKYRYGVVRHFVGHGVGRVFHADPVVLHFSTWPDFELSSLSSHFTYYVVLIIAGCPLASSLSLVRC